MHSICTVSVTVLTILLPFGPGLFTLKLIHEFILVEGGACFGLEEGDILDYLQLIQQTFIFASENQLKLMLVHGHNLMYLSHKLKNNVSFVVHFLLFLLPGFGASQPCDGEG